MPKASNNLHLRPSGGIPTRKESQRQATICTYDLLAASPPERNAKTGLPAQAGADKELCRKQDLSSQIVDSVPIIPDKDRSLAISSSPALAIKPVKKQHTIQALFFPLSQTQTS
jgi:hypothetical protein